MDDPAPPPDAMLHITVLPPEILHHILQWLDPADIVILPRVCSAFRDFTKDNRKLFRDVYLNYLDTPKNLDLDWEREILDLVRLQVICHLKDAAEKKPEQSFVYDVVNRLLQNASPSGELVSSTKTHAKSLNASLLNNLFKSESTREAFLQSSFLFERVRNEHHHPIRYSGGGPHKAALRQRSAKLHCLYGKPILHSGRLRSNRTYPYACSKVYDLRQYTLRTRWGPFLNDGSDRVDWEKVEAILIVLGHNIGGRCQVSSMFSEVWDNPFSGSWPGSYSAPSPSYDISSLEARDPYDVTGIWYRIVCFLDYNDLFSYNFPVGDLIDPDTPRPALNVQEATRIMMMRVQITKIEAPGPDDGQDLPVVHFKGTSRSLDDFFDDISGLRGTVRLTKEGEVRWTTFSIFHGQERWRSEGVQIGGVRSARGVVGNWFDIDYDEHGPAGPTAFWKGPSQDQMQRVEDDLLPSEFFGVLINIDDEFSPEMELDSDFEGDDDDDEEEEIHELSIQSEIPGLLMDAGLDLRDVVDIVQHQAEQA